MKIVDAYLVPILETAVAKHKEAKAAGVAQRSEEIGDDETLLDHLVNYTDGMWRLLPSWHMCVDDVGYRRSRCAP